MGYVDLMSLQPVDKWNRPMNMKKRIFEEYKDLKRRERSAMGERVDLNNDNGRYQGIDDEISEMTPKENLSESKVDEIMNKRPRSGAVDHIKLLYQELSKFSHSKFIKHLSYQNHSIGNIFFKVADFLKYPSKSIPSLVQDQVLPRYDWEQFYIYLSVIELWRRNLKGMMISLMLKSGEPLGKGRKNFDRKFKL